MEQKLTADHRLQPERALVALHQKITELRRVPIENVPDFQRIPGLRKNRLAINEESYRNVGSKEPQKYETKRVVHQLLEVRLQIVLAEMKEKSGLG